MLKILRITLSDQSQLYTPNEEIGKAVVNQSFWNNYVKALETVDNFENEINKQYENSK